MKQDNFKCCYSEIQGEIFFSRHQFFDSTMIIVHFLRSFEETFHSTLIYKNHSSAPDFGERLRLSKADDKMLSIWLPSINTKQMISIVSRKSSLIIFSDVLFLLLPR